ncbi:uncharacterized protein LOC105849841 isoform X1 [Hydra vulgaris]|uniref:uncharacterized protein LOC105849841 isoform X1 n=1 Tax=Hydra vulgaris TaxID=6087 RepID=UPI001F5E6DC2|nr:uncharacterized protein LOC105849841 [Hydra vulgaris]
MNIFPNFVNKLLKQKKEKKQKEKDQSTFVTLRNNQSVTFELTMNGVAVKPPVQKPESISIRDVLNNCHIATALKGELLMSTEPPEQPMCAALGNSLIGALYDAYKNHYAISIRPDDVWLTIIIELAEYVDNHAEEMRHCFVTNEGRKTLTVIDESYSRTVDHWACLIKKMSDLIDKNTKADVRDFIEPQFTTTTPNDSLIGRVALMGAMKNYFEYEFYLVCGIPQVTLMGTIDDWEKLKTKIVELGNRFAESQPQLGWWSNILVPIANKFISSYKGKRNEKFWQSCIDFHDIRDISSCLFELPNKRANKKKSSYFTEWALAFSPFFKGQWRLDNPKNILKSGFYGKVSPTYSKTSAVQVDFKVNENGYTYYFYAGSIVNTYQKDTNTIRPNFDFAMFKVSEDGVDS